MFKTTVHLARKPTFKRAFHLSRFIFDMKDIKNQVTKDKVVLYMKGSPDFPRCGFSRAAVEVLKKEGVSSFATYDVLQDDVLRQAIKEFSNWPTLPQVYINGEFVGGSDILLSLHKDGQLKEMLKKAGVQLNK